MPPPTIVYQCSLQRRGRGISYLFAAETLRLTFEEGRRHRSVRSAGFACRERPDASCYGAGEITNACKHREQAAGEGTCATPTSALITRKRSTSRSPENG